MQALIGALLSLGALAPFLLVLDRIDAKHQRRAAGISRRYALRLHPDLVAISERRRAAQTSAR